MSSLRKIRRLSIFLILLLLANSSQALETLAHGSHGHGDVALVEHGMHDLAVADYPAAATQHDLLSADDGLVAENEDQCVCADICCVSSTGSLAAVHTSPYPHNSPVVPGLPVTYQSVSLDLLLPPPNL